jgi:type I restriction enzyme S subunit
MSYNGTFQTAKLAPLCRKIGSGATPRGGSDAYLESGPFSLIRSQNVYNNRFANDGLAFISKEQAADLSNVEVSPGDVLLNITGDSVARCCQAPKSVLPARVNQHVAIIRPDANELDPTFLRYFLVSPQMQEQMLTLAGAGATRNALTKGMIENFDVPKPGILEQRAIASVLSALDDKIELNWRMNETLEALAQSLFKSWFVDATLLKRWREGSILEVAKLLSGGTPKTERQDYWNGNILWASAKDVSQCGQTFLVTTERTITEKGLQESATQLIPAFCTVVVARGATTGRMTMFGREMAMNQTCYALASTTVTPFALYCLFRHAIDDLVQTAHGSVFDTITTSTFAASKVVLPPQQVFKEFEKTVSPIFMRILANIKESGTLAGVRDALLPKLLSGELRVPDGPQTG